MYIDNVIVYFCDLIYYIVIFCVNINISGFVLNKNKIIK